MLLNLRQLEIFRAIMITKTVSGAAELLHVSQPGVSRALKYIEQRLKLTLFERSRGRLVATPEAEELYKELEPIYARLEGIEWTLERITRGDKHMVRIGCTPSLMRYVVPKALALTKQHMPDVVVRVDALSNEELADYISDQKGSYALSLYDPDHPMIIAEKLMRGRLVCVMPKSHRLASREIIEVDELAEEEMILYHPDTALGHFFSQLFKKLDITPRFSVLVRYTDDACSMVEQGLGISFVTDFVTVENSAPALKAIPLALATTFDVFTIRHKEIPMSHTSRLFFEHFKNALNEIAENHLG